MQEIPVQVEGSAANGCAGAADNVFTDNARPVLNEIRHALHQFHTSGETTLIDLTAMPFGPGDEEQLLAALGTGEVAASVHALGETVVHETAYAGVWLVEYRAPDGARQALHVEVTDVPSMLRTPPDAIPESLQRLDALLHNPMS